MTMDIEFSPYDDISYHLLEMKTGVRCVIVRPFNEVRTDYVQRDLQDIVNKLCIHVEEGSRLSDLETKEIEYVSNGIKKKIVAIYLSDSLYMGTVIRYENISLVYSNACIIVGEGFTDLTMEQCYALVKSARVMNIDDITSVSVNITKDMDLVPRIISDDEKEIAHG